MGAVKGFVAQSAAGMSNLLLTGWGTLNEEQLRTKATPGQV